MLPPRSQSRRVARPAAAVLAAAFALAGCSMFRGAGSTPDNEPTLKTLANRKVSVDKEDVAAVDEKKAIEAYRKFLDIAPAATASSRSIRSPAFRAPTASSSRTRSASSASASPT